MKPTPIRSALAATAIALLTLCAPSSRAADPVAASDQAVAAKAAQLLHDPRSPVLGNPNGDVTIVEFFDYACPVCKGIEPRVEALLQADKGVRLIVKEFPILTPESLTASKAAFAAAKQGKYAPFHQALMSYKGHLDEAVIFEVARSVGLDVARLRKDMAAPDIADEIYADLNLARSLRIFGTPGLIVGNHIVTDPATSLDFPKAVAAARAS
jgi:protein-disulfide isomerase